MIAKLRYEALGNNTDGHGYVILDHREHSFVRVHTTSSILILSTKRQAEALVEVMNAEWAEKFDEETAEHGKV